MYESVYWYLFFDKIYQFVCCAVRSFHFVTQYSFCNTLLLHHKKDTFSNYNITTILVTVKKHKCQI